MVVKIHCTKKLLKALSEKPILSPEAPTNRLGGWYANLIDTPAGELILFTSEVTQISVLLPPAESDEVLRHFPLRVRHMLQLLEIPQAVIEDEMQEYEEIVITKTANRKVVAAMNRIAAEIGYWAEAQLQRSKQPISIAEAEITINSVLRGPAPYFHPDRRTKEVMMPNEAQSC